MKKIQYILYLGLVLLITFTSCRDEFFSYDDTKVVEGLPASIILGFKSQENTVVTRAERDPKYENRVDNIYIFIFDSQGNVHYRKFFNTGDITFPTESHDKGTLQLHTQSLNHARIVGIANVSVEGQTSTAYTITEKDLDNIQSQDELENKVMLMDESSVERYAIFMMTGMAEDKSGNTDITIPGTEGNTPVLDCSIKLRRTDAKVKFVVTTDNINGYEQFSFSPRSWVVKRVPKQSYILPKSNGDYNGSDAQYFTSLEMPFEVINRNETNPKLYDGGSFVYYMPENRKKPKTPITGSGTDEEQYALREKWSTENNKGDKNFLYANENSTYVEMTGLLSYINEGKNTNADIRLIVHLGNPGENGPDSFDANNYNTNRNTFYTYKIKIRGVNDIKVEVESTTGEEPRPGYEGDVVDTENRAFTFDSHYDRCLIKINPNLLPDETGPEAGEIYWSVNTPFSRGVHTVSDQEVAENLRDYRWIKFAVNAEYGVPEDEYVKYPGDQNYNDPYPFAEQENDDSSPYYSPGGAGYKTGTSNVLERDIDSEDARLLDINQLMKYLRQLKKDGINRQITITVFVDEYLYFKHPIDESYPETGRSLWKLTSDKEDRILYLVINKPQYSTDGNSSVVKAEYSFRQRTIRTIFDVDNLELTTAWGLESVMETGRLATGNVSLGTSTRNGRENCLKWLVGQKWTDIISTTQDLNNDGLSYDLRTGYDNAAFACMLRNRDLNGDNIIQDREVRWYLASIDQLTDIYLGEYALDEQSRLYPSNPADRNNQTRWHYTSSSANGDQSWILWAEEGASRGGAGGSIDDAGKKNTFFSYRCVRNLGIDLEHPEEVPTDIVQVIPNADGNIQIDMSFMNKKARRSSYVTELPNHNEREDVNRPYEKFMVHKDAYPQPCVKVTNGGKPTLINYDTKDQTKAELIGRNTWIYYQTMDPSPDGYRIPNQREFLIMTSRLKSDQWPSYTVTAYYYHIDYPWQIDNPEKRYVSFTKKPDQYICQTAFSMYNQGIYKNYKDEDNKMIMREGFIWNINGVFFLQNHRGETGWIRPVKDVR